MKQVELIYKNSYFFTMFPNEKYVIYVPLPNNHCHFCKNFQYFFLEISHKKNSIRRCKLRSNSGSTFLFDSFSSNSNILFFKTISANSAQVYMIYIYLYNRYTEKSHKNQTRFNYMLTPFCMIFFLFNQNTFLISLS